MDQNNGISIYNSAAPQPSQAAQASQAPVQNQDGTYSRAANGEQQPNQYNNAPNNQQLNQKWQQLSDQLNNQQSQGQQTEQQPVQNNGQQNQTQNNQDKKQTCQSVLASVKQQFPADLFEFTEEELAQANQEQEKQDRDNEAQKRNGQPPVAQTGPVLAYLGQHAEQVNQYYKDLTAAESAAGLQCSGTDASAGQTNAAAPVREGNNQQPAAAKLKDKDPFSDYFCKNPPSGPPTLADLENANDQAVIANERDLASDIAAKESDFSPFYPREHAIADKLAAIAEVPDFSKYDPGSVKNGNDNGISSFNYIDSEGNTEHATVSIRGSEVLDRHGNVVAPAGSVVVSNGYDTSENVYVPNCNGSYSFVHTIPPLDAGEVYPDEIVTEVLNALATAGLGLTVSGAKSIVRLIVDWAGVRASAITVKTVIADAISAAKARVAAILARQAEAGGSLAQQARALLGKPGDVIALGRLDDTANFVGRRGFAVLNTPNWSLALNDEFIKAAIEQGRVIRLVSPLEGNMIQTSGQFAGQPTIYARELDMLTKAGYTRVGDYMRPPA
ncbi:hypothetical protein [Mycobacteroides abscessus]|uniref:hypothetical protein n=1 Tax=Mycobacteroides abscessus TaxID=36809 RepID=UPI001F368020|nr:hypothetical protein [Mycobacteroides abscessus]